MRPILFLDIDGVLNSVAWNEKQRTKPSERDYTEGWMQTADHSIDPDAVARLNRVVKETRCLVVLSSSWRKMDPLTLVTRMLRYRDFQHHLFAATPHLENGMKRGAEIAVWLCDLAAVSGRRPPFAIVDDGDDMEPFMDRLVQTDHKVGLTDEDADRLIALLKPSPRADAPAYSFDGPLDNGYYKDGDGNIKKVTDGVATNISEKERSAVAYMFRDTCINLGCSLDNGHEGGCSYKSYHEVTIKTGVNLDGVYMSRADARFLHSYTKHEDNKRMGREACTSANCAKCLLEKLFGGVP